MSLNGQRKRRRTRCIPIAALFISSYLVLEVQFRRGSHIGERLQCEQRCLMVKHSEYIFKLDPPQLLVLFITIEYEVFKLKNIVRLRRCFPVNRAPVVLTVSQGLPLANVACLVPVPAACLRALPGACPQACGERRHLCPRHCRATKEGNGGTGIYSRFADSRGIHELGTPFVVVTVSFSFLPSFLSSFFSLKPSVEWK